MRPLAISSYEATPSGEMNALIRKHGGIAIYVFKLSRLVGCIVLMTLCLYTAILTDEPLQGTMFKRKKRKKHTKPISPKELVDLGVCLASLYATLLSLVIVGNKRRWSRIGSTHLTSLLMIFFGVYVYRDLLPFATFGQSPLDLREGWALWAKVILLFLLAVIYPITIPRQYVPVDPKDTSSRPSPEQTAPLASLVTYAFLDPVVKLAHRVPRIEAQLLPRLADYDSSKYLRSRSLPVLREFMHPGTRHLFFGLMRVFKAEYFSMSIMILVQVIASFASPIGVMQLLEYIESNGAGASFKPWLWIIYLFAGPSITSLAYQWYMFVATRVLVRVECIVTQLVFDHSLRIRAKAEVPDSSPSVTPGSAQDGRPSDDSPFLTPETNKSSPTTDNLIGMINNLVTTDLANVADARDFLFMILYIPLQISLCVIFLYNVLGWSAFVGLAVMVFFFPLPGYVAKSLQGVHATRMEKTDARVEMVSEAMNVLRMIKMFGWEGKMWKMISEKREEELKFIWKRQVLEFLNGILNWIIPVGTMVATYFTFSITVFDMLKDQLHIVFFVLNQTIAGKVSLDRIDNFVKHAELIDRFSTTEKGTGKDAEHIDELGLKDASFTWSNTSSGSSTPSQRRFTLRVEEELRFLRNKINVVIGPTGSGKTSLLMALLGEMHFIPTSMDSWYNLPRDGGVAYAPQESWVQNETIRENILFGSPFDEKRYNEVIHCCGLGRDMAMFEAGDRTEVGERGITLSGGQKARITLARAVYSLAEILLLDDVFAALDVHTAKWIVQKCFSSDLIRGRTVILVTHNVALVMPVAHFVVTLGSDGRVVSQSNCPEPIDLDQDLAERVEEDEGSLCPEETANPSPSHNQKTADPDGQLITEEEVEDGHVSWSAAKMYFAGLGGKHPALFFFAVVTGLGLCEVGIALQTWFLGYWASQYQGHPASDVPVLYYVGLYVLSLVLSISIYILAYVVYIGGAIRASRALHNDFIAAILGTTLRWLDTTPISGVIARCTQDIRAIDGPISAGLFYFGEFTATMVARFAAVIVFSPIFLIPGVLVAVAGGLCAQLYIAAQLSVKREMSTAKAPVLGHFGASISGLSSLRAYGAERAFTKELMKRIDRYTRAACTYHNLNRWVCVRVDAIGGLFAAGLATYLVYFKSHGASNTGFSLNMAVGFSGMILWWIQRLNELEVQGNSLERVEKYTNIEQEAKSTASGTPPAYWPSSGTLQVRNLSARYSLDGPEVLKGISFEVKAGERIGIVGRTGSGKSSLTLALLRCIYTEGEIIFDGIDTKSINLEALRSNITIIPQIPELLSGTLRQNLDPFDQYDDLTLNNALRASGLYSVHSAEGGDEAPITLDSQIAGGGSNLSVGQRQILALARAIIRDSKLLILDEATSAIDHDTDAIIQSSLRNELGRDVSVITVAHRLQTVMDADKIMVLDEGHIVEFGTPSELLENHDGRFRALVDESGDREHLFSLAKGRRR